MNDLLEKKLKIEQKIRDVEKSCSETILMTEKLIEIIDNQLKIEDLINS